MPIDARLPSERRSYLLAHTDVRHVLAQSWLGLDDPGLRSVAIASDPQLGREAGEAIVPDAAAPTYAQLQAAAERSGMTQQQNPGRLRSGIATMPRLFIDVTWAPLRPTCADMMRLPHSRSAFSMAV